MVVAFSIVDDIDSSKPTSVALLLPTRPFSVALSVLAGFALSVVTTDATGLIIRPL